jgi:XTP/dITP diphosphohydrolase
VKAAVYCSSSNPGKLREFALAAGEFGELPFVVEPLPGLKEIRPPAENGDTFEENAAAKALYYSQFTSVLVFADDSGLEVDALAGAPGVCSARYAGRDASDEANNALLLERLAGSRDRRARFVCVLALAQAGHILGHFRGVVEGEMLQEARGRNGFGYDPLFFYPPLGCSFGEIAPAEKFRVSHRGQALRILFAHLRSLVADNSR